MAFVPPPPPQRPKIDLRGPDGNVFCIMGYAQRFGKQLGLDVSEICDFRTHSYEETIMLFEAKFGDYVDLILPEGMDPNRVTPPKAPTIEL